METTLQNQSWIPDEADVRCLLFWYRENRRILPWRENISPYRTWISEIMLQQTRVEAVKPYFERFLQAFPTIGALAEAEDDFLMKLWEGLGYYSRARNLKKAAQTIVSEYGGELPSDAAKLLKLSGIGSYTAGAILSIAFGKRAAAVDGNVLRVLSRLTGFDRDILLPESRKWAEELAFALCPETCPGDFTQALIELGATVCVPNGEAKCENCPMRDHCFANHFGKTDFLPVRGSKKPRKIEERTVLLLRDRERCCFFIRKRPDKGLLAGLFEFPGTAGYLSQNEAIAEARALGFDPFRAEPTLPAVHVFTHKEWHMNGWLLDGYADESCELIGVDYKELRGKYAIPSAFSAFLKYAEDKS